MILNVGSGDNTVSSYPREIQLDSYSIVNQANAQWKWEISPAPLAVTSYEVRNPVITIAPDQTYDISLTVTTPSGSDTKCIKGMIKGNIPVPEITPEPEPDPNPEQTSIKDNAFEEKTLLLQPGNVVIAGEALTFVPRMLKGAVSVVVYDSKGSVVARAAGTKGVVVETAGFVPGVHFYMATDEAGYRNTGKLLVK
jgi:hypothetical protein